eukprot:tig00000042_g15430.t1
MRFGRRQGVPFVSRSGLFHSLALGRVRSSGTGSMRPRTIGADSRSHLSCIRAWPNSFFAVPLHHGGAEPRRAHRWNLLVIPDRTVCGTSWRTPLDFSPSLPAVLTIVADAHWTPRDDYLISVGGADLCVMQWRREK